jgi:hypothetical protein
MYTLSEVCGANRSRSEPTRAAPTAKDPTSRFNAAQKLIAASGVIADDVTVAHAKRAKGLWGKVRTRLVVQTVITEQLAIERTEQVKSKFSFLVKDYQPCYYYFECVFLIEKLILTGLLIFVPPGTIAQCYIATLTAFVFCVIQTKYMPYETHRDNILKQLCEIQLLMTLLISIILRTDLEVSSVLNFRLLVTPPPPIAALRSGRSCLRLRLGCLRRRLLDALVLVRHG